MNIKAFFVFIVLFGAFLIGFRYTNSAAQGSISTYLPFAQRGNGYTLPNGNLLLYSAMNGLYRNLFLSTPETPPTTFQLTNSSTIADFWEVQFAPDGSAIAFVQDQDLWLQPADGTLTVRIMDSQTTSMNIGAVAWSPDSQWIAFSVLDTNLNRGDFYRYEVATHTLTLISDQAYINRILWSPSQSHLYYVNLGLGVGESTTLYRANADGTAPVPLFTTEEVLLFKSVLANGQLLIQLIGSTDSDLYLLNPDNQGLTPLTDDAAFEAGIAAHPQGNRFVYFQAQIMYQVNEQGTLLWQHTFPCDQKECEPSMVSWAPDGSEIKVDYHGTLYTVPADGAPPISGDSTDNLLRTFAYSPDNRYFAYGLWDSNVIRVTDRATQTRYDVTFPYQPVIFYGWRPVP